MTGPRCLRSSRRRLGNEVIAWLNVVRTHLVLHRAEGRAPPKKAPDATPPVMRRDYSPAPAGTRRFQRLAECYCAFAFGAAGVNASVTQTLHPLARFSVARST